MIRPHRNHPLWYAFIVHRVSGVALALFLPLHFWVLAQALNSPQRLDEFFSWTDNVAVKLAEMGLVLLLAAHLFGGLRLLALEFLPWTANQKTLAAAAAGVSFLISGVFLLQAI